MSARRRARRMLRVGGDIVPTGMRPGGLRWSGEWGRRGDGAGAVGVAVLALPACHAGVGVGPATPTAGDFTVVERAETGPITALAVEPPFLWAAGAPGLRRWDVGSGRLRGGRRQRGQGDARGITAIARRRRGERLGRRGRRRLGRWVVDEAAHGAGEPHYQTAGSPGDVVALAPRRPVKTKGVWAGGPGGLFRYDGRAFGAASTVCATCAVTWLRLDEDGVAAWVGTRARRSLPRRRPGARPGAGRRGRRLEQVAGDREDRRGHARGRGQLQRRRPPLRADAGGHGRAARAGRDPCRGARRTGKRRGAGRGPVGRRAGLRAARARSRRAGPRRAACGSIRGAGRDTPLGRRCRRRCALPPRGHRRRGRRRRALRRQRRARRGPRRRGAPASPAGLASWWATPSGSTVACRARDHCLVVTDGPSAWQTDGDRYRRPRRRADGGDVLALATDARGDHVRRSPPRRRPTAWPITKRAAAAATTGPVAAAARPLELPAQDDAQGVVRGRVAAGALWVGLARGGRQRRRRSATARWRSISQTGHAVQHRPRTRRRDGRPSRRCRLPADLTGDPVRRRRDLVRVAIGGVSRWPARAAAHLERERRPRERALLHAIGSRRRRRDVGGDLRGARALRRQELAPLGARSWRRAVSPPTTTGALWVATDKGLRVIRRPAAGRRRQPRPGAAW